MKNILVLGAGRSTTSMIDYLLVGAGVHGWEVRVGDVDHGLATQKCRSHAHSSAFQFDLSDDVQAQEEISKADLVISMLPAKFHPAVARICVDKGVNMITASYTSGEIKALDAAARAKDIIILNECGLDPGIDHMSAMKVIDKIRNNGHKLIAFESFTGGLLAPDEKKDNNPWQYKFTWNPRNVVLAGQGVAKFIREGQYKYIPYQKVFRRIEQVHLPGYGNFEGYANRNSLQYLNLYGLQNMNTIVRGTFRRPGFCGAWDVFVQLGATDDTYEMESVHTMTHRTFIDAFLFYHPHDPVEVKLARYMQVEIDGSEMHRLKWLGMFDDTPVGLTTGTPAQILEHILKKKWTLSPDERDMIVMWHRFVYLDQGEEKEIHSTLVAIGDDDISTAMSKTVGLPLGIAAKLILQGKITGTGVKIPIEQEVYGPVLEELSELGIELSERQVR